MTMTNAVSTANKYQMGQAKPVARAASHAQAVSQARAGTTLHVHMGNSAPAAVRREADDAAPATALGSWASLGVLALLFAASVVYVALGGVFSG
jgi:hypothetical protein